MDISICLCTFRRPALLDQLLSELARQNYDGLRAEIVVVDNDAAGSGLVVVDNWRTRMPIPLHSDQEPTPNIALARNAAVRKSQGEFILFIDDDESPEPDWVQHMMATQRANDADAVIGPVGPRYPAGVAEWIKQGGFFAAPSRPTGTRLGYSQAYSGNTLLRRAAIAGLPGPFDPAFGVTGGSDTMLFWELERQGARTVWCEEGLVTEDVPVQRANLTWILRRAYRGGQSFVRAEITRLHGVQRYQRAAWLGARACVQLVVAGGLSLLNLPFSRVGAARWLRTACAQLGKLGALIGHRYREYAKQ